MPLVNSLDFVLYSSVVCRMTASSYGLVAFQAADTFMQIHFSLLGCKNHKINKPHDLTGEKQ